MVGQNGRIPRSTLKYMRIYCSPTMHQALGKAREVLHLVGFSRPHFPPS